MIVIGMSIVIPISLIRNDNMIVLVSEINAILRIWKTSPQWFSLLVDI